MTLACSPGLITRRSRVQGKPGVHHPGHRCLRLVHYGHVRRLWRRKCLAPKAQAGDRRGLPGTRERDDRKGQMTEYRTGTREEWLAARRDLLDAERSTCGRATSSPAGARSCLGGDREGVRLRHGQREEDASRALRRPLAAARLPLHVRLRVPGYGGSSLDRTMRVKPRKHLLQVRARSGPSTDPPRRVRVSRVLQLSLVRSFARRSHSESRVEARGPLT